MQQANGEKNPAYSITTTTDVGHDIVAHIQVNEGDNDPGALGEAIEGSRQNTGEKHEEVEAEGPVKEQGTTAKGDYDRSKFSYRCPAGQILRKTGTVEMNGRQYERYENARACAGCAHREQCTRGSHRRVFRDHNEEVRERMRGKLRGKRSRRRYHKRAHSAESPYGNVKGNLKFRSVMRRGIGKVRMEVALVFMLHNMLKLTVAEAYG
jgi:hypothetical protein